MFNRSSAHEIPDTPPLLQGQPWLGAVKRLNLRLLVDRKHHRMGGRRDVEPHHIVQFLGEGPVV